MIVVCLVGHRNRSSVRKSPGEKNVQGDDQFLITQILSNLKARHGGNLSVISYACDDGIGKLAKDISLKMNIKFGEIVWYFHGENRWESTETAVAYLRRNATAHEFGDLFVVLTLTPENSKDKRRGMVEDLVDRLKKGVETNEDEAKPFVVLDESGTVIEEFKQDAIL